METKIKGVAAIIDKEIKDGKIVGLTKWSNKKAKVVILEATWENEPIEDIISKMEKMKELGFVIQYKPNEHLFIIKKLKEGEDINKTMKEITAKLCELTEEEGSD